MLVIPLLMAITFWCFIHIEEKDDESNSPLMDPQNTCIETNAVNETVVITQEPTHELTFNEMTRYIKVFV